MTADHRPAHSLDIDDIISRGQAVTAKIQGTMSNRRCLQRHEILSVGADVDGVVIDGVLVTADAPIERTSRKAG